MSCVGYQDIGNFLEKHSDKWMRGPRDQTIRCQYYIDTSKRKCRRISHFNVLYWCNFDGRKINIILMYFLCHNFDRRKSNIAFAYFFRYDSDEQKIDNMVDVIFIYMILMDKKSTLFWCIFSIQFRWKTDATSTWIFLVYNATNSTFFVRIADDFRLLTVFENIPS